MLLHLSAHDVLGGVALAEPHQAHGLLAVEGLEARLEINIEILGGIGVVHPLGHVKLHAAHQIHQLDEYVQLHQHVAVHLEAQRLGKLGFQGFHAVVAHAAGAVDRVDLGHGVIAGNQRIPGDTHQRHGVIGGVQPGNHDGIGAAAVIVGAADEDVVKALLVGGGHLHLQLDLFAGVLIDLRFNFNGSGRGEDLLVVGLTVGGIGKRRLLDGHRLDKITVHRHHGDGQHHHAGCQQYGAPLDAG